MTTQKEEAQYAQWHHNLKERARQAGREDRREGTYSHTAYSYDIFVRRAYQAGYDEGGS